MSATNPQQMLAMLNALVQPWNDAITDPARAQQQVVARFLQIYAQTDYGKQHNAAQIGTIEEYRRAFRSVVKVRARVRGNRRVRGRGWRG